jgi:putative ABC transport system permease protein
MPGVRTVETLISLPVQLQHGGRTYDTVLQGLPSPSPLLAVLDAGGSRLQPRPDGAVLSRSVATILHVAVGGSVQVRLLPRGRMVSVRIGALSDELVGNALTLPLQAAADAFGVHDGITTVLVTTDPRQRALVTAILFNTASISVIERRRELATMRALGERMGRLSWLVTVENGLLALGGLLVGFPVALACLWSFLQLFSTDLFSMPYWLYPRTVILSAVGVLLVMLLAQAPALRGVASMNVAEAAKARE